jgi:small subunit ribosomal protein S6
LNSYLGTYIFDAGMKDEGLESAIQQAKTELEKLGGRVSSTRMVGKRTFARPMKKKETGVYVDMDFEMPPDKIAALHARYRLMENLFRVQIVRRDGAVVAQEPAEETTAESEGRQSWRT